MKNPLGIVLCLSASSHSLPHTSQKQSQTFVVDTTTIRDNRRQLIPARVRGLSRQLNIFGDEEQRARNNFEARRKMSGGKRKGKGKYDDDSADPPMGIGLLPYENSEDGSAMQPEMPLPSIPENSEPGSELPFLEIHENSAPGMEMPPLEIHENSAPGLGIPSIETHENSAAGLDLPPLEIHENSAPGVQIPPHEDSGDMQTTRPQPNPTQAPNEYWSTLVPQPSPSSSQARCQADSNGNFGSNDGDETVVNFLYQMELFPGVTVQEGIEQIENALLELLIVELFPEECGDQASRRHLQNGEYIGVSSSPPDAPAVGCKL